VKRITSRHHPIVARIRAVARGETADLLLLDGIHLVLEAMSAGLPIRQAAIAADAADRPELQNVLARLNQLHVDVVTVGASVMTALSPVRSSSPVVAVADRPRTDAGRVYRATPFAIVAVDVQDPGNLGAIVRVAEAGGATGVVAAGASADPFGWKALRGSMGSAFRLPIISHKDGVTAIDEARRHRCRVVAMAPRDGRSLFDVHLDGPVAVLIGGEGQGLTPSLLEAADERVTIPMQTPVESLNAAVTAALVVYEARRQRQK
jgi:TrmH family RNA methyltransferase